MARKKYKWWCGDCSYKWKSDWDSEDLCPNCECDIIFYCDNKKKKKKKKKEKSRLTPPTIEEFLKFLGSIGDTEVYEGSLEVCECEDRQVCDVCQEVVGKELLDNLECEICGEFKHPDKFIGDGVCHDCHDEQHEELNEGHYMELMDRIHIIQCTIEEHLSDHPAMTPEMRDELSTAQNHLGNVYQWAGSMYNYFDLE